MQLSDIITIAEVSAAWCGGVGVVGAAVLYVMRRRSIGMTLTAVSFITILAMALGMVGAERAMFLTGDDLGVAIEVCVIAGLASLIVALILGRQVVAASRALQKATREIGEDGLFTAPDRTATVELADLSRELELTSTRLAESRSREKALERSRRELVAWVSHDLRTPLAGLRAMAEALEDGVASDPGRYHKQIRAEVDRLAGMVDDLFELSRIHAGALRLTLHRVSLAALVSDAMAGAEALAAARGVRLSGWAENAVPVEADGGEITRVLSNLVVNAIRHTPSDGTVEIVVKEGDGVAIVTVSDCCGGIPADDLERVFDVAWRGNHARTPGPDGGAGLGLAIVRGIVQAHAGEVTVANTNVGCQFTVRLPERFTLGQTAVAPQPAPAFPR